MKLLSFALTMLLLANPSWANMLKKDLDNGNFSFEWQINGENLDVKLTAKTEGWVSVGFNPTDMMKDANILIGYVKDGQAVVEDHYGNSAVKHKKDKTQNVSNVSGKEENGITELSFTIPLSSGDKEDYAPIAKSGPTKVILAYGKSDSIKLKHTFVTTETLDLSTGK